MSNTQQIKTHNTNANAPQKTSALDRFSLGFEYDKTLQEIKREVRIRTI
ncbi:MAG: hypothetical protein ACOH18_03650 [Candidatus Saccharimonadaceae bacterium]